VSQYRTDLKMICVVPNCSKLGKSSTLTKCFVLDFRHFVPFRNAGSPNASGIEN